MGGFIELLRYLHFPVFLNCRCGCESCDRASLVGALEYRCCTEVHEAYGKLVFEGVAEEVKCVTNFGDYKAITNKAVLELVGPMLKDKKGKAYKRRAGQTKNE